MSVTLGVGATQQLSYQLLGPLYGIGTAQWSSSNPSVASVNAVGTVTANAAGTATITASLNGITGTTTVTVSSSVVSQDGSLPDFRAVITDLALISIWDFATNTTTDGTHILGADDARGSGYGPSLTGRAQGGNAKPLLSNGVVTFSSTQQNWLDTPTYPGYATTPFPKALVIWGNAPTANTYFGGIYTGDATDRLTIKQVGGFVGADSTQGGVISTNIPAGNTLRAMVAQISKKYGYGSTTQTPYITIAEPPILKTYLDEIATPNTNAKKVTFGGLDFFGQYSDASMMGAAVIELELSLAHTQVIQRRATFYGMGLPTPNKSIMHLGDSLTAGTNASSPGTTGYGAVVKAGLPVGYDSTNNTWGYAGRTAKEALALMPGLVAEQANPLRAKKIFTWWLGTNDNVAQDSPQNIINYNAQIGLAAMQAGYDEVVPLTMMNRGTFGPGGTNSTQTTVNTGMRNTFVASGYCTRIYDVQAEPNLQNVANATYFEQGNQTHLTDAGYAIVGAGLLAVLAGHT